MHQIQVACGSESLRSRGANLLYRAYILRICKRRLSSRKNVGGRRFIDEEKNEQTEAMQDVELFQICW